MSNLSSLKKELGELKAKNKTNNKKTGFEILDKYKDGELTYEQCMELLKDDDYVWGDVVVLILQSGHYDDDTKRKILYG